VTRESIPEQHTAGESGGPVANHGGEAVDMRGAQGPVYKPTAPVTQHFTTIIYEGTKVVIPSLQAIADHRAALREQLETEAQARWGGMSVYIQEEGATLPIEASPYQTGRFGPRQNLLDLLSATDRLLVLGEPGSGKTVTLERLAWELCSSDSPTVPVLIRLFQYDGTGLAQWMRAFLQSTGYLRLDSDQALTAFLKGGDARCFFLFDGLNEVAPPYRDRLVGELVRWAASYPRHPVILTSRSQDELWRRLRRSMVQAVVVQSIGDEQAQAYLVAHLGTEKGNDLYARLDERLRGMAQTPLVLWLIKEAGAAGESVPGNRGELYARFVSRMLRRDTDRRIDAQIPERVKRQAMAALAYYLSVERKLYCSQDKAIDVVAQQWGEERARIVVEACARHGLLAGDDPLWFAPHQTVQEYFAALALQKVMEQERNLSWWAKLGREGRWLVTGQQQGLAGFAADDWWMETFVQLAGLADDADWLAREVALANPWLAWWCVQEGREVEEGTRNEIANRSERLLASKRVADRRRAVAALTRMQSDRALLPLLQAAADSDREVAELAAQALAETGEAVRTLVTEAFQGADRQLWRITLRYLRTQPDDLLCAEIPDKVWEGILGQPMIWVPRGSFLMGSDAVTAWGADIRRLQYQVELPGYWISRYPVTVSVFRAFAEKRGYGSRYEGALRGRDDHPVTYVDWHDAMAYCRWLTLQSGMPVTLPSEAEWEKAARGTKGRRWPWGDQWDAERCNSAESGIGDTTPVGKYSPQGDSPYGCADMAGNVWEWTRSIYKDYPYDATDGREDLDAEGHRVLRGGAFDDGSMVARCARRYEDRPDSWGRNYGFRIVVSPGFP
jgi:formylglycine-generating enzyme required for sulfatase activity